MVYLSNTGLYSKTHKSKISLAVFLSWWLHDWREILLRVNVSQNTVDFQRSFKIACSYMVSFYWQKLTHARKLNIRETFRFSQAWISSAHSLLAAVRGTSTTGSAETDIRSRENLICSLKFILRTVWVGTKAGRALLWFVLIWQESLLVTTTV